MRSALILLAAGTLAAAGIRGGSGRPPVPFVFPSTYTPATVAPGVHFSGFDAPEGRAVSVTGLLWNQWRTDGTGTARFEVLNQSGGVECYIDVDCAAAPGVDTRTTCSFTLPAGEHTNIQANAGNTCSPDGQLVLSGSL